MNSFHVKRQVTSMGFFKAQVTLIAIFNRVLAAGTGVGIQPSCRLSRAMQCGLCFHKQPVCQPLAAAPVTSVSLKQSF